MSGAVVLGLFLLGHLWSQSHAIEGRAGYESAMSGRWSDAAVVRLLVLLALVFHALFGIVLILRARRTRRREPAARNWRDTFQRVTGLVAAAFLGLHAWTLVVPLAAGRLSLADVYPSLCAQLSTTHASIPLWALGYVLGTAACAFHLGNGLHRLSVSWGIGTSKRGQRLAAVACGAVALLAFAVGANATVHLATGSALAWPYSAPATSLEDPAEPGTSCPIEPTPSAAASTSAP